jgi:hypothetical protein
MMWLVSHSPFAPFAPVRFLIFRFFEQEVTEETEGLRAELYVEILISLALEL